MLNILKCVTVVALLCASASAKDAALPRDGDYLSTAYLAALDKTKSHHKAAATHDPQTIAVSRDKRGLVFALGYSWHEGTSAIFDLKNLSRLIEAEDGADKKLVPIDTTHFRYDDDGGSGFQTYEYVGKVERFIAEKLLVGTYADARGRKYVFGADGKAQFPRTTFRYEIYTDVVFEPCDEITDLDTTKQNNLRNIGFEWKGDVLYLYHLDCSGTTTAGCIKDRKQPLAVLHKVHLAKR